ncbi:hypothetical protein RhiXN_08564 [Rhizoctonia solani]|uniref:Chromo domain-containing protein n=1 Tax=Rhizoctonia solani TaxID=456999 RepID=A0A8H8P490_9AGAM|nr:uncharacterized protein RhiXN_08564 [Rhizoctonia solani]QRW23528.1 hypothetical protein RhiXN_08564 [Rhizoctonia solani]
MKIHDVFHVSLLSAFKHNTEFDCTFTPLPPVITAEGEEEYQVDKFVDWAAEDRIRKYRVRWKGYAPHEDTWEPAKDLQHCKDKLRNFFASYALAANNPIPANAHKVKRGKIVKQLSNMPIFSSINALAYNPCLNIDCYIMNGPEEMRAHLDSSANIIHALMSASSCNKWGFLHWLNPRGEVGPNTLYGKQAYCWWHFIASHPGAFRDLARWHCHGFATPPPTVSTPLSARGLTQAMQNLILLYPADPPAYTSRPAPPVTLQHTQTPPDPQRCMYQHPCHFSCSPACQTLAGPQDTCLQSGRHNGSPRATGMEQ